MAKKKLEGLWNSPLTRSRVKRADVKLPELLIGYLIGPFGAMLSTGIFTSYLQNYFTDVLKLPLSFLTTLQLFSTILIVAANLVAGQLIERTKVMAGKARPWLLLSAFTMSTATVLMFVVPFEGAARMVWIAIAYNLYYAVAYPIYSTANSTMVPVSTRNSQQRGMLASMSNMGSLAVMGAGSMVFPVLVSTVLKEDQSRWLVAMVAVAIIGAMTIYLQFLFTRERVTEESLTTGEGEIKAENISIARQLKAVTSDKMWWIVMIFTLVLNWGGAMKNGSMAYFCKWVLDNSFFGSPDAYGASQSLLGILGAIPMAVAATFVVPLANRFGKRIICFIGLLVGVAGGVIAGLGNGSIIPVAIGIALKCLGSAPSCYMTLAMLADVIDHVEYRFGIRTDGLTMSLFSCIMVAATPICNSIFSAILGIGGYNQHADLALGNLAQSASARGAISISYIWVETIAFAACAVLIWFFTVEKDLPREQAEIAARKAK